MHEFSIAKGITELALAHSEGKPVTAVKVRVGPLRRIVPATLEAGFARATQGTAADGARLELEVSDDGFPCPVCERDWIPAAAGRRCAACGPGLLGVGRQLEVEWIEVEEPVTVPAWIRG